MKKILLSFTAAILFLSTQAQQLSITNATLVVNGTTADWDLPATLDVTNISNSSLDVTCERTVSNLVAGHENNFCWGIACYPASVSISPTPATIDPGIVNHTFISHLNPMGIPGTSYVTYCFYDANVQEVQFALIFSTMWV